VPKCGVHMGRDLFTHEVLKPICNLVFCFEFLTGMIIRSMWMKDTVTDMRFTFHNA